jgi:hypothetical protein
MNTKELAQEITDLIDQFDIDTGYDPDTDEYGDLVNKINEVCTKVLK